MSVRVSVIVAMSENSCIGKGNDLMCTSSRTTFSLFDTFYALVHNRINLHVFLSCPLRKQSKILGMSTMIKTSVIVARASDKGIGCSDGLPWHIPEELKYFKKHTLGKPVIMGRKTFESIVKQFGKSLPDRTNIVVSRSGFTHPEAMVFSNLGEAISKAKDIAKQDNLDEVFVIGGREIFKQAIPIADKIYLTEIQGKFKDANAFLSNKDMHFDRLEIESVKKETLIEKSTGISVVCEFKVYKETLISSPNVKKLERV